MKCLLASLARALVRSSSAAMVLRYNVKYYVWEVQNPSQQ
eukprot:COSAG02_NODE_52521_length_307_cov_0.831731_1_plen_39_part_01